jgi:hypothetical protein
MHPPGNRVSANGSAPQLWVEVGDYLREMAFTVEVDVSFDPLKTSQPVTLNIGVACAPSATPFNSQAKPLKTENIPW